MESNILFLDDSEITEIWRKLQTSDHFYYMCTKWSNDGDVHAYFSPYQSPYDAYTAFMNALSDLQLRVQHLVQRKKEIQTVTPLVVLEKIIKKSSSKKKVEVKPISPPKKNIWDTFKTALGNVYQHCKRLLHLK